ncbi:hypothetical protein [Clostridioides sp. ZZV14-6345]|uniref:hypothetical protein n=1 Tax=Clostridioides sp. ZZV14-6345 TaxID=2811496 RepID=UPI001D116F82|nr:hypothetical protein [Clostridioides sp. ZZV14-6345]
MENIIYKFSITEEFDNFLSECQNNALKELKRKNIAIFNSYYKLSSIIDKKLSSNDREKFESYREQKYAIHSLEFDFQYKSGYKHFIKLYMSSKFDILKELNRLSNISIENFRRNNSKYLEELNKILKIDINDFLYNIDRDILKEYVQLDEELNNLMTKYLFLKGHIDCMNLAIVLDIPIDKDNKYIKSFLIEIEY